MLTGGESVGQGFLQEVAVQVRAETHGTAFCRGLLNLFAGDGAQRRQRSCAGGGGEPGSLQLRFGERVRGQSRDHRAALTDGACDEVPGQRRGHEGADRNRPGRLAGNRHLFWISAERRDIPAYPLESGNLIQQAVVAGRVVGGLLG